MAKYLSTYGAGEGVVHHGGMSRCFGVLREVERKANYPKPKKGAVQIRTVELLIFPIILVK